ncbi:MAG: SH3 domain-containing protein [Deltaproteobacteria bacterium]|nr:SH3 domain-containing protein [Deltaproteobacteria bacterium]
MRRFFFLALVSLLAACSKSETTTANTKSSDDTDSTTAVASKPAEEPIVEGQAAYLLQSSSLLKQATNDRKIENPETHKKENNWKASLYRGEEVKLLKKDGEWTQVKASDGTDGWIKSKALLIAEGVSMATVLEEVKTFNRPDFLAPSKTVIAPGSLLYIIKKSNDDTFSEVNYSYTRTVWVETSKLETDSREIAAARVVSRAISLAERKDDSAAQYWDLAKSQFGDTKVVQKALASSAAGEAPAAGSSAGPETEGAGD